MGAIEYLRTKASVDLFIKKFGGNVKLQLSDDFQPALSSNHFYGSNYGV